ncbi:MAG: hypothetical protein ACI31E_03145 [Muribaculaceae bacterium]
MNIEDGFTERMHLSQVRHAAQTLTESGDARSVLRRLLATTDRRQNINALWVMTYLDAVRNEWLQQMREEMIEMLHGTADATKKRLLLQLLSAREYGPDDIPTDFLDFCLAKINSEIEPYAVRAYCMYCALKMCRHYPELTAELELRLDMMEGQSLSPGIKSALRRVKNEIRKFRRR